MTSPAETGIPTRVSDYTTVVEHLHAACIEYIENKYFGKERAPKVRQLFFPRLSLSVEGIGAADGKAFNLTEARIKCHVLVSYERYPKRDDGTFQTLSSGFVVPGLDYMRKGVREILEKSLGAQVTVKIESIDLFAA